jgi:dienelactone hydrolase
MSVARRSSVEIGSGSSSITGELTLPARTEGLVLLVDAGGRADPSLGAALPDALARSGLAALRLSLVGPDGARPAQTSGKPRGSAASVAGPQAPGATEHPEARRQRTASAARLVAASEWALANPETGGHPIGLLGLGLGAAAAFDAAAARPDLVAAIVAGDLGPARALESLPRVQAPTLLIAAEGEGGALACAREVLARMDGTLRELAVLPRLERLEGPLATSRLAAAAVSWFERFLVAALAEATGIEAV